MNQRNKKISKQVLIIVIILVTTSIISGLFILLKPAPEKVIPQKLAPLVEVTQLQKRDIQMTVTGYGTARAKTEVEIAPQVSGKIVSVNREFKAGGFIKAGEQIIRIDPRDYQLAVRQAEAGVADAEVKLELEKSEAAVAIEEWKQLHPGTEPGSPLVLRQPQIKQAQALLDSAEASLATAQLNLDRTSIELPVDARIMTETADLGQFVTTGQSIGRAYGIDAIEIEVPLEDKDLAWFDIPDPTNGYSKDKGSDVLVKADFAGKELSWKGFVKRTVGQVDAKSRLVYIVVEVPEPFKSETTLLPGTFVETQIQGDILKNAFAIPRNSLHNKNEVWIVNDNKLHITTLNIVRDDKDFAYTTSTLTDGDLIITSSLDAVVDGMTVRISQDENPEDSK
ncbi:MAG: efflux RND transporter periplasmic adaptor subunit [Sedimentisphaerales bacterium]|nr:efflux RND transporter periplasmic adaptor subunit [Sedimentisphaerales bacterium]